MSNPAEPSFSITDRGEWLEYSSTEGTTGTGISLQNGPKIYPGNRFIWDGDTEREIPHEKRLEIFKQMLIYLKGRCGPVGVVLYERDSSTPALLKFCEQHIELHTGVKVISNQEILKDKYEDDLQYLEQYNRPLRIDDKRIENKEQLEELYRAKGLKFPPKIIS